MAQSSTVSDGQTAEASQYNDLRTDALLVHGEYTGDGTTSQGITGVGFQPVYVKIWTKTATPGTAIDVFETTTDIVDDDASGGAIHYPSGSGIPTFEDDAIISLDADGFTVDDDGSDSHPNQNGVTYHYIAKSG